MKPVSRRSFLSRGVALASIAGAASLIEAERSHRSSAAAGVESGGSSLSSRLPFSGHHQSGIVNTAPAQATFVALDCFAPSRAALAQGLQVLSTRAGELTSGGTVPVTPANEPPVDSGLLGPINTPDGLTVTIGLGASLFDGRYGLQAKRPRELITMPTFPVDQMVPGQTHGDLLLQICAQHRDTVVHALRELLRSVSGVFAQRWSVDGFKSEKRGPTTTSSTRNLFGFRDGTANPSLSDPSLMRELVWVGDGEPEWAQGGTYQVVRVIRMHVEFWDRIGLREQENIIGRSRSSGAPLGGTDEFEDPRYDLDPQGARVPLDAHMRLANPRTPATASQRMLRRGFNYHRGFDQAGELDQGLVFVAFNRSPGRQFVPVQQRLNNEPMTDYVSPVGGGYFFVPPGARSAGDYVGSSLFT